MSLIYSEFATSLAPAPLNDGEEEFGLAGSGEDEEETLSGERRAWEEDQDDEYVPPNLSALCCCCCGCFSGKKTPPGAAAPVPVSALEARLQQQQQQQQQQRGKMRAPNVDPSCVAAVSVWEGEILRPISGRCHRAFFGHPEHPWEAPEWGRNVTGMVNRYLMNSGFIAASNGLFSDSCVGVRKKLFVDFDTVVTLEEAQARLAALRAQLASLEATLGAGATVAAAREEGGELCAGPRLRQHLLVKIDSAQSEVEDAKQRSPRSSSPRSPSSSPPPPPPRSSSPRLAPPSGEAAFLVKMPRATSRLRMSASMEQLQQYEERAAGGKGQEKEGEEQRKRLLHLGSGAAGAAAAAGGAQETIRDGIDGGKRAAVAAAVAAAAATDDGHLTLLAGDDEDG